MMISRIPSESTRPDDADRSYPSTSSLSRVKRERSPSPVLVERKLVTSGTKRFVPIPNNCLTSCTEYRQNRLEWVASSARELEALNLIPERRLLRDDGLVIDWRSHVPVWSDTLKPDPQDLAATIVLAHRSNAQWRHPLNPPETPSKSVTTISIQGHHSSSPPTSDAEPPLKKRLPVPPRPSSRRRNNTTNLIPVDVPSSRSGSSCLGRPRPSDEPEIPSQNGQIDVLPKTPGGCTCDHPIAPNIPSAAEEEMSEMTLSYLRRYVQTYECDRASLASAYASNASFGYRAQGFEQNAGESPSAASPQCLATGSKRTRLDIVTALLKLPSLHSTTANSGTAQIQYDIFYLGAKLGMFVVCRMVDSAKTVVHNFILQRKEVDVEDAVTVGVWPLTATVHQILVLRT